jgi:hypothetical protein
VPEPRQLPFNPRPVPPGPEPGSNGKGDAERASEVTDLSAKERNRRAAE